MFPGELEARKQITRYSHKVHAAGLVSATDGNLSIRLDDNHILITPSSLRKEEMYDEAPIVIDINGELVSGDRRPSTERKVHLEAYRQRPDVRAVIHAHPPKAIAFTIANQPLSTCTLPEVVVTLGDVPVAPYATPSTDKLPQSMSELIRESDAVMLARHGSVTVGKDLEDAFKKLEKLEHNAEILIYATILGGPTPFSAEELAELQGLRDFYGVKTHAVSCVRGNRGGETCGADCTCGRAGSGTASGSTGPAAAPLSIAPVSIPAAPPRNGPSEPKPDNGQGGPGEVSPAQMEYLIEEIVRRVRERM